MPHEEHPGQIIILNGVSRSGKSSIVTAIQDTFDGLWMNLGVDRFMPITSARFLPGIGLRPGGERPDIETFVPLLYSALYDSIAVHSGSGINMVVDVGHHEGHARRHGILMDCAQRLSGLPVLFVGVRCPVEVIMERQHATGWNQDSPNGAPVPPPIFLWQQEVHRPGVYDLEVDTSAPSPGECAGMIRRRPESGPHPTAFQQLAAMTGGRH